MNISKENMNYINACKERFMDCGRGYWSIFQQKYPQDCQQLQEILGDMLKFIVHGWEIEAESLYRELKACATIAGASDDAVFRYTAWKTEREIADGLEVGNDGKIATEK